MRGLVPDIVRHNRISLKKLLDKESESRTLGGEPAMPRRLSVSFSGTIMYRVKIDDIEVICDDEHEVLRLARAARISGLPAKQADIGHPRRPGRPRLNGKTKRVERNESAVREAVTFLKAVFEAGSKGLTASQVVSTLNLKHARGIGGALVKIKRILGENGFDPKSVVRMGGDPGDRRWKPVGMIPEAIEKLETHGGAK